MKILILDDLVIEITPPKSWMKGAHDFTQDEIVQTCRLSRFLQLLESQHWDEVWLDHDLGENHDFTGKDVTRLIAEITAVNDFRYDVSLFRIISMNPAISDNLSSDLKEYDRVVSPIHVFLDLGIKRGTNLFIDPETTEERLCQF